MKKVLRILIILILLAGVVYVAITYFFKPTSDFQSIYLVPANAAFIIESDDPIDAWQTITQSNSWNKLRHVNFFSELNEDIQSLDSIVEDNRILTKIFGHARLMVSCHPYAPGKYDYLYILNAGRITRLHNPENLISSIMGDNYPLTSRNYKGTELYEMLDKKSGEMYYFSFLKDKAIFSTTYKLVEASIDEKDKMTLGRDLDFIDISKRVSGKGLFDIYINYRYFTPFLNHELGQTSAAIQDLPEQLHYSGFLFDMNDKGELSLEGYSGVNDSVPSFFSMALLAGNSGIKSLSVVPARVASLAKISFDNATDYYHKTISTLNSVEYNDYIKNLNKLEKKLKISVEKNFLSWMDDEIVLIQTQPSNLGRSNEFAAILKAKDAEDATANLRYVERQIERNTPIRIRQVNYQGYRISYISFPGLLKTLFGKMLDKIEKPYYTIIDDYVVFSNHPQTLKNIIDDYKNGNVLKNSEKFNDFAKLFSNRSSAFVYFDVPVLFSNLRYFVSQKTWASLKINKPFITCFPQAGIQLSNRDDLLHLSIKAIYSEETEDYKMPKFETEPFLSLFSESDTGEAQKAKLPDWTNPEIIINDLDDKKEEGHYDDGKLQYTIGLKSGLKNGNYREYFENGEIKVKGHYKDDLQDGTWKLYDEQGNLLEEKSFDKGKEESDDK